LCVLIDMEIKEIIIMAIGTMVSVIAFYLKRESIKIEKLSNELRTIEIDLAKNSARDAERWEQTQKLLEDRRVDVVKIFEKINNGKRF
jgi:hypothetical protein